MNIISTEIQHLQPIPTAAISYIGDFAGTAAAYEALAAWATDHQLWEAFPNMACVLHDNLSNTPLDKLHLEACLQNPTGIEPGEGMHRYVISGGTYFVMQVKVTPSSYAEAWLKAYAVFNENGYEYDARDHYELSVSCCEDSEDASGSWIANLCIPMK